jgi:YD repeat-containing protein
MKQLVLSSFLLFFTSANAQKDLARVTGYDFHEHDDAPQYVGPKRNEFIRDHKISSKTTVSHIGQVTRIETIHYNKNGYALRREYTNSIKYSGTETFSYDAFDRMLSRRTVNSKGELVSQVEYTYNSEGKTTRIAEKYGKVNSVWVFAYDENGNRIYESGTDRKGKSYIRKKIFDPKTNKVLVSELYQKDTLKAIKRLEYSYYEDGSTKSIHYFEKDELMYTWNFDCAPEGQLVDLKKTDSTLVCIKKEKDADGNETVWRHEFNSSGIPIKIKSVYNSQGKLRDQITYREDGTIYNQKTFFQEGGYLDMYYDKDGRSSEFTESFCNLDGQMIKLTNGSGKKIYKTSWFSYDQHGLISVETHLTKKRTIVYEYSYTFFE